MTTVPTTSAPTRATPPVPRRWDDVPAARTHDLLSHGVPLSLLLDLADPRGPRSEELYLAETGHLPRHDR
ncbi:MAG: hypothetical protein JWN17_1909 [Frankiales bacterium]|nr:hypothetical protein [Frankiales bacterium]